HLPVLTAQRIGPEHGQQTPGEIDKAVREAVAQGEALYTVDEAKLTELKPDVVLTQDLCDVCSIDLRTVQRIVAGMPNRPEIVNLNPETIEDVLDDLLKVGRAVGREDRARAELAELRSRMLRAEEYVNAYEDGPVVGFMEWTDPIFVAGHWNAQLIERAGGRHPLNATEAHNDAGTATGLQAGERRAGKSIAVAAEDFARVQPEVLVIAPCGLGLDDVAKATQDIAGEAWFKSLPAVQSGRAWLVDGNQMFNRPGPRLLDAFEWLVSIISGRPEVSPNGFPAVRLSELPAS
ncbi:MAG: ABC transporter substrate-binding protein, partial [Planctomycetota bacterium]